MSSLTPVSSEQIREFYSGYSDLAVFQDIVGINRIPGSEKATEHLIVICINTETWIRDHSYVTELGLNAFQAADVRAFVDDKGPHCENILKQLYWYHQRLLPNTHLVNNAPFFSGDPEANRFGGTRFATYREAKALLDQWFTQFPIDASKPQLGNYSVVILGHAIHGDLKDLKNLKFDAHSTGNLIRILDTQSMARTAGIPHRGFQIGLQKLVDHYDFEYRDPHTASNDAAYTVITAIFMAVYGNTEMPACDKSVQQVIDDLETNSVDPTDNQWGITTFCTRCHRTNHLRAKCKARVCCQICKKAGRNKVSRSHVTEDCRWRE